jgi:hypothetical protein
MTPSSTLCLAADHLEDVFYSVSNQNIPGQDLKCGPKPVCAKCLDLVAAQVGHWAGLRFTTITLAGRVGLATPMAYEAISVPHANGPE